MGNQWPVTQGCQQEVCIYIVPPDGQPDGSQAATSDASMQLGAFFAEAGQGNLLIPADPCSSKLVLCCVNTGVLKSLSFNDVRPTGIQALSLWHLALERLQIF